MGINNDQGIRVDMVTDRTKYSFYCMLRENQHEYLEPSTIHLRS